jgi:hypothetical protein
MKHIKLFEQFLNEENDYADYQYPGTTLFDAVKDGRYWARYSGIASISRLRSNLTTVKNENEYSVDVFKNAIKALKDAGITSKDTAEDKKLVIEFSRKSIFIFEYVDGKWARVSLDGRSSLPMNIYQFLLTVAAYRYEDFKDKPVGKL